MIVSAREFDGELRRNVVQWKYGQLTSITGHLADIVSAAARTILRIGSIDVVTWAPTSPRRRRKRGYDQAELLARAVAWRLRLPCRELLRRVGVAAQTGRSRADRLGDGPRFVARPSRRWERVLVIDDVVTTGSTLWAAEAALKQAGYGGVSLLALARTPKMSEHDSNLMSSCRRIQDHGPATRNDLDHGSRLDHGDP